MRARKLRARGAGPARDKGKRGRSCGRFFCPRVSVSDWAPPGRGRGRGGGGWRQVVVSRLGWTPSPPGLLGFRLGRGARAAGCLRPPRGLARSEGWEGAQPSGCLPGWQDLPRPRTPRKWSRQLCMPRFCGCAGNVHPPQQLKEPISEQALGARQARSHQSPPGRRFPFDPGSEPRTLGVAEDPRCGLECRANALEPFGLGLKPIPGISRLCVFRQFH